jgi:putative flippase GtrA
MRTKAGSFVRFLVVGGGTALACAASVMTLVDGFHLSPVASAAIVAVAGNIVGFIANRHWSFEATRGSAFTQAMRYLVVATTAVITSVAIFAILTDFGLHYVVASLSVSAFFAVVNFLAHFHWSFAHEPSDRRSM